MDLAEELEIVGRPQPRVAGANAAAPAALLLVANGRLGYRVLRCLAGLGEGIGPIIVLASRRESSWPVEGLGRSRFCSEFIYAERGFDDARTVDQVNRIVAHFDGVRVLAADMLTNRFLSRLGEGIAAAIFPVPDELALSCLARKDDFARFCVDAEIPHPRTWIVSSLDELEQLLAAGGPKQTFVLKPVNGQGGVGVRIVQPSQRGRQDIAYRPIVVQEYTPGTDLCASAFCRAGRVEAFQGYRHITKQILGRQVHVAMEFFQSPLLRDLVEEVAVRTRLEGIVNFDARLTDGGHVVLIECNPRPWFTMHMAMLAGTNFLRCGLEDGGRPMDVEPVKATLPLFPGGLLNLAAPAGLPWKHLRHMLADTGYYVSVDWWNRLRRVAGAAPSFPD